MQLALLQFAGVSWLCRVTEENEASKQLQAVNGQIAVLFSKEVFEIIVAADKDLRLLRVGDVIIASNGLVYNEVAVASDGLLMNGFRLDLSQFKEAKLFRRAETNPEEVSCGVSKI